jgi:putative ATP-binding cassette transporter
MFSASEVGGKAKWLLACLLVLLVAINALNVLNSYVGRDFMTALETRTTSTFIRTAILYVGVFALSTLATVFLRFTEETLALTWREWLSRWAVRRYLMPPVYLRLNDRLIANGEVANPDQRIADDVRAFTSTTLSFLILFLNGSFTILAFSGVMWSISPPLFGVTVLYSGLGSLLAIRSGRPLVKLNAAQLDKEANFRSELIHVREYAEPLMITEREDLVERRLSHRIDDWAENLRRIIRVNRNLGMFTTGYNYLIQILPALVVAPLFIRGKVEFGVVTQSAMAFAQLVGALSLIITQFQSISSYAAAVSRLGVLDEGIDQALAQPVPPSEVCVHHLRRGACPDCAQRPLPATSIEVLPGREDGVVEYDRLTLLSAADGRVLAKEISGSVGSGTRLLILGPNDETKSALYRATAGTWSLGSGRILRPGDDRMMFVSERPYFPPGTLREILVGEAATPTERILKVLRELDFEPALARIGGLEVEKPWNTGLSLGELKLLAFARVMLSGPCVVFLERPETGIAADSLRRMLDWLAAHSVSVMTVGRPADARRFYNVVLELDEDGGWRWKPIPARQEG